MRLFCDFQTPCSISFEKKKLQVGFPTEKFFKIPNPQLFFCSKNDVVLASFDVVSNFSSFLSYQIFKTPENLAAAEGFPSGIF